ncbi:unnamed protein product [Closterium sp. Naga37s-1]|nr:unnamed protein product [Closterium sp. Naga37s-1]
MTQPRGGSTETSRNRKGTSVSSTACHISQDRRLAPPDLFGGGERRGELACGVCVRERVGVPNEGDRTDQPATRACECPSLPLGWLASAGGKWS